MIVVAARFRALAAAEAAVRAIRIAVPVGEDDVAVRPLGTTRYEAPARDFVVAGRFDAADVDDVISAIHAHGGSVFERRDEMPRAAATATPASQPRTSTRLASRPGSREPEARLQKRLRRPAPPLRNRTALRHRIEG